MTFKLDNTLARNMKNNESKTEKNQINKIFKTGK